MPRVQRDSSLLLQHIMAFLQALMIVETHLDNYNVIILYVHSKSDTTVARNVWF